MSYRELRNFKEILTVLGYPRLISIENFKTPHFELVADILIWLCQRYDKNMEILDTITTRRWRRRRGGARRCRGGGAAAAAVRRPTRRRADGGTRTTHGPPPAPPSTIRRATTI